MVPEDTIEEMLARHEIRNFVLRSLIRGATQVESLKKLIVQLRVMVHDDNLYDLGDVDHAIAALGIVIPDLEGVKCERLQRLASLLKLPHDPEGYTLAGIERAVEDKVNWP